MQFNIPLSVIFLMIHTMEPQKILKVCINATFLHDLYTLVLF